MLLLLATQSAFAVCGKANKRPCTVLERIPSCDNGLVEDFNLNKCVKPKAPAAFSANHQNVLSPPVVARPNCGALNQRPCLVTERVPSCDKGLVENFSSNRCTRPAPVICGGENQRPCLVTERVPSCNSGLVENFSTKRCTRPAPVVCGAENQRPCTVTERIPSCNNGLAEDFNRSRCVRSSAVNCGARNQRPCLVTERMPSCNQGLVEDFKVNRCLYSSESSVAEFERFAQRALQENKPIIDALVEFSTTLSSGATGQYFSSGQFMQDVKQGNFNNVESHIGVAALRQKLGMIQSPLLPRAVTIGVVGDGGVGIGGNVEQGVAINLTGDGPLMDMYRTFGVSAGLITGASSSVVVSLWKSNPRNLVGETRGLSFGAGKVVNPATGISVGAGLGFWFAPLKEFPGAIGFDYRQFQGLSISVGVGASVLPVDLRGTAALTQIWQQWHWMADACGELDVRPCHVVERVPSCNSQLKEDFLLHKCVQASPVNRNSVVSRAADTVTDATISTSEAINRVTQPVRTTVDLAAREQQCHIMVQGKVAWDRAGHTQWNENNVTRLCSGTQDPYATINCFRAVIQSSDNWQQGLNQCGGGRSGTDSAVGPSTEQACYNMVQGKVAWDGANSREWNPDNVNKLCKGTGSAGDTVDCFIRVQRETNNWSTAIDKCRAR
jgi:hypothetical protein